MAPRKKKTIMVSACLTGVNCTYDGRNKQKAYIKKMADEGIAIPVCPEMMGGLGVPRENSEIVGGDGTAVLKGKARIITASGRDVTRNYLKGARRALAIARRYGVRQAILKSKSPSCGIGGIYDGSFSEKLRRGSGLTAAILRQKGIRVYSA